MICLDQNLYDKTKVRSGSSSPPLPLPSSPSACRVDRCAPVRGVRATAFDLGRSPYLFGQRTEFDSLVPHSTLPVHGLLPGLQGLQGALDVEPTRGQAGRSACARLDGRRGAPFGLGLASQGRRVGFMGVEWSAAAAKVRCVLGWVTSSSSTSTKDDRLSVSVVVRCGVCSRLSVGQHYLKRTHRAAVRVSTWSVCDRKSSRPGLEGSTDRGR
jgi:hypothetical protein